MLFSQISAGFSRFCESQKNTKLHAKCELSFIKKPFILGAYKMKNKTKGMKKCKCKCMLLNNIYAGRIAWYI